MVPLILFVVPIGHELEIRTGWYSGFGSSGMGGGACGGTSGILGG